jgi:hypothetical protein
LMKLKRKRKKRVKQILVWNSQHKVRVF